MESCENFAGDKKVGVSLLGNIEKKFVQKYVGRVPKFLETYHLTVLTIPWCVGIIIFSYLAQWNIHRMWLTSLMIVMQYLTDAFDGAVGRLRNTGLIKWGYYMDHFLDYVFLCSILIGYSFVFKFNDEFNSLFFVLAIFGAFMVNSYLSFASTNEFKIEYLHIGPTEIRLLFIFINTMVVAFGSTHLRWSLPWVLIFSLFGLCYVVYETQKYIWKKDMEEKNKRE